MKRIFALLIVCVLLTGCTNTNTSAETTLPPTTSPELSQVPDLRVTCGEDTFSITSGNYFWTAPGPDGEMSSVIACGSHPLDRYITREFRQVEENLVVLSFSVEPDSISVLRWPKDADNITMNVGENVELDGLSFTMEEGSWIYQIIATWDRDTWSGEAEYDLYLTY